MDSKIHVISENDEKENLKDCGIIESDAKPWLSFPLEGEPSASLVGAIRINEGVSINYIEIYEKEFEEIIEKNNDIENLLNNVNEKLDTLKETYNNLIKQNSRKMFVFCLDSFFFQYKLLKFEIEKFYSSYVLIDNRMYGDYYKLYNVIFLYCKNKNIFTPFRIEDAQSASPYPLIKAHKVGVLNEKRCKKSEKHPIFTMDKYSPYKDLEPLKEYSIEEITAIHLDILIMIRKMFDFYTSKTTETNKQLKNQIILFLNYISFFHTTQRDYLLQLSVKIMDYQNQLDIDLLSNNAEALFKKYNLYKPLSNSMGDHDNRSSSPNKRRHHIIKSREEGSVHSSRSSSPGYHIMLHKHYKSNDNISNISGHSSPNGGFGTPHNSRNSSPLVSRQTTMSFSDMPFFLRKGSPLKDTKIHDSKSNESLDKKSDEMKIYNIYNSRNSNNSTIIPNVLKNPLR